MTALPPSGPVAAVLARLSSPRPTANGWSCRCPAHDDRSASLVVSTGADGRVLLHCHAGCTPTDVVTALGLALSDLFANSGSGNGSGNAATRFMTPKKPPKTYPSPNAALDVIQGVMLQHGEVTGPRTATYEYFDSAGMLIGVVARFPTRGGKTFRPVSMFAGGWKIGDPAGKWPLFRLNQLRDDDVVVVVEGEKCALAAAAIGLNATASQGGAQKAHRTDWTQLANREIWILPDCDAAGESFAVTTGSIVQALGAKVRFVRLPGLDSGEDIVEFIERRREDGKDDEAIRLEIEAIARTAPFECVPQPPTSQEDPPKLQVTSMRSLIATHTQMRPVVIDGLLRVGETMNVISAPKIGKSWLALAMAISVRMGTPWNGFPTTAGRVLLIDNELHTETLASRMRRVGEAYNCTPEAMDGIDVLSLRGRLQDLGGIGKFLASIPPNTYSLIIIDAWYRTLPVGVDENDNAAVAGLYNTLDSYADRLRCAFVLVHHSSKGNQDTKSVTDVGSGAGSQSRAADTHLILRPHEEDNVFVLEAAVRSFAPVPPKCLRWSWPFFTVAEGLDPERLLTGKRKPAKETVAEPVWDARRFAATFGQAKPRNKSSIIDLAVQGGVPNRRATALLDMAIEDGLLFAKPDGKRVLVSDKPFSDG